MRVKYCYHCGRRYIEDHCPADQTALATSEPNSQSPKLCQQCLDRFSCKDRSPNRRECHSYR